MKAENSADLLYTPLAIGYSYSPTLGGILVHGNCKTHFPVLLDLHSSQATLELDVN